MKIAIQFTALTFIIPIVTWVISALFGLFGFTVANAPWLYIFTALCAISPTIASYIVLKRNNRVIGFAEWLKNVFAFKSSLRFYMLVIMLIAVYYVPQVFVLGSGDLRPFYIFFASLPVVLFSGGIEEAGWSYVLRPELDKKYGFIISSLIAGIIWAAWHILLFSPQERIIFSEWYGLFTISCIGLSFALGAIIKITKNVWLCVLFRTISSAVENTRFGYSDSLFLYVLSASILIVVSIAAVLIYERNVRQPNIDGGDAQ